MAQDRRKTIGFSLLENAQDSIERAVDLLAWQDCEQDSSRLKQSILNISHAVELLLKERLRRENPALIWEDVDRFPNIEARTVTADKAISRLRKIVGISISEIDEKHLKSLRITRNAIEHYEWSTTVQEAKLVVGTALSFALHFSSIHLGRDLSYEFRRDDTWRQLIDELETFAKSHGQRLQQQLEAAGTPTFHCEHCGQPTVPYRGGACELCGHWNWGDEEPPF